ncbi:TlpA family protein disulfide reductase [Cellvibrio japonicus]|uniref:Thioredoxin domain-containing protein n=1 Tax=Cellvibrio japonicus (strain Ueda107) TaxID=498211 RepID=B3PHA5_CELJU|nr:redoxin domain-containing protein [Cellvibrio japonicus]ACE85071.1 hypothetical protein CJA_0302 [Cellvibrio japonicus Ueda107]QEI11024.1 redoxin domain-containing protein [Cellvibrio japonicus]QEI14599.1 redoxin domain-containing protein [Cellvibrio japonicus]QEI18178.1 redoxin domain-containing protein [Cellvibrio japonicus]
MIVKIIGSLLIGMLLTLEATAKPLQLDAQYAVFDGDPVSLQQVLGKQPVYLKFWASWCLDCRRELPHLQQTYERYRDRIAFYAVNLNINEEDTYIQALKDKHQLTIPIVMDNNGSIAGNFQFHGTPFHVLINRTGDVVYTTYKDDAQLASNLEQLASLGTLATAKNSAQIARTSTPVTLPEGLALVYFATTWCDWYMADIHPDMARNCTQADQLVNQLHKQHPNIPLQSYVSHLWTEEKYLKEYIEKFNIRYPVTVDTEGAIARYYQNSEYPTLLLFDKGKELKRFSRFENPEDVLAQLNTLLGKNK